MSLRSPGRLSAPSYGWTPQEYFSRVANLDKPIVVAAPTMVEPDERLPTFAELLATPEWWNRAACRGKGVELFFVDRGVSTGPAKALCATCTARTECLEAAVAHGEDTGVWGGRSPKDRRGLTLDLDEAC